MRVEGVDPLILNQIQNQTVNTQVQQTRGIKVTTDRKQQEGQQHQQRDLHQAVEQLNKAADTFNVEIRFKVDNENNELYVYVIDTSKGEIIRRIPPENVLDVASRMERMVGLILDTLI
ncbi:flagellar protein FlaG [Neomoorella thermoacetica]|uniref:flagellar protein FlaG n=1 Tax=Neomoorella thermoacetica TaxID=1525 RepID=UPI0030CC9DC5